MRARVIRIEPQRVLEVGDRLRDPADVEIAAAEKRLIARALRHALDEQFRAEDVALRVMFGKAPQERLSASGRSRQHLQPDVPHLVR